MSYSAVLQQFRHQVGCFPFKLRNLFSVKDSIPKSLRSRLVKFSCADCGVSYVGEINEPSSRYTNFYILQHLQRLENCQALCSKDWFPILNSASSCSQLKIKEALHIHCKKPTLNRQSFHVNLLPAISFRVHTQNVFFLSFTIVTL